MSYSYLRSLEKFGINLGLERIRSLMNELGNPHLNFRSIHVAGTNGKGSTCAMIASILKEAGYKVGLYTSPHLFEYTERIKISGEDIPKKEFLEGINKVKNAAKKLKHSPTVFEALTAVAFWYFAKKKVDYAVVEVGMGGRLDATNVITPLASVITNIDHEHTAILGKTLSKIAGEKAAIIKPGVPAVTAETKAEPLRVMKKVAERNGSILVGVNGKRAELSTNLIGTHQNDNAACAIAAIRLAGIKLPRKAIVLGLKKVSWPARFQVVTKDPLTIVDGAHNPAGIRVLKRTLAAEFPGRRFEYIIGVQKDKDAKAIIGSIKPFARSIIITRSSHRNSAGLVSGTAAVELERALKITEGRDRVVTGSLYLAADALKILDPDREI